MSRASLTGHYLSAPAVATPAAATIVTIFAPDALDTTDGTIVSNILVAGAVGFLHRILGNDLRMEAYSDAGLFTPAIYTHVGIVGGGRIFCYGRWSGANMDTGVGGPSSITPGTATFASGAIGTGTPADTLTLWTRLTGARDLQGSDMQFGMWDSALSDAQLDAGAASMDLRTMPAPTYLHPLPRVRAGVAITSTAHMRDAANPARVWTPTGTGTDLTGAAL
ncbi:MAG: hypothetical protein GY925_26430 [Actinomycetia bacterium]|nr:hypothetical protein [Actinomycetes bacterium]